MMIRIAFFISILFSTATLADTKDAKKVYIFDLKEEIAPPAWRLTQRAFAEAQKINADYVLIRMNTYGGSVLDADSIRTKILHSPVPVMVFIDNNAASAGALISIACDSIYMATGANIGAATVVNQTAEKMPDKYQSYMRAIMRSTAEANGRDPKIAEAMVDDRTYIEGIIDSGKVLTFTTSEAIKNGFCEGQAESVEEVMKLAGITNYTVINHEPTFLDKVIGWLISPAVSGILIILIVGGIYFELQAPGLGLPSIIALTGALLYFAPLYLEGLAENWEILIFIIGLGLLALEIFVIPGFGVAGVSGIALIVVGLSLSMINNVGFDFTFTSNENVSVSLFTVITSILIATALSVYIGSRMFKSNGVFRAFVLSTSQKTEEGYVSSNPVIKQIVGKTGVAFTMMRPSGKVEIEGEIYDATAETGFIDKGEKIEVRRYEAAQVFVRRIS
jgi:membrane-bound serine protease (ClpP class)